ncbi:flagellar export chaperone FliS [Massilia sp. W12]|uniref:flagellar export chaperone FliS n=1 Tax=Massilia sp. W12 TaxID=3126507 RepID=UPI0030CD5D2E
MFGSAQQGANAYANIGIETGVAAATPHRLVIMLYEGAMVAIAQAIAHMKAGNIPAKGQAISKAVMIIESGLRASLDKKAGQEIAQSLDSLYEYMGNRLLLANLRNQPEILEEVHRLLTELKTAWDQIGDSVNAKLPEPAKVATSPYDGVKQRSNPYASA